jgi:hypothetical protein
MNYRSTRPLIFRYLWEADGKMSPRITAGMPTLKVQIETSSGQF